MEKQRYPAIFGSAKRWASVTGVLGDYYALEERDFIGEIQGFGSTGKKRYEAVIEEGWLRRICVPDNPQMRNGIKRGKRHYVITFGEKMAPFGRPETRITKNILLHLVTTAQYRHCIPRKDVRRWYNEIWLKEARPELVETYCNGYAPDALIEMQSGEYWGVELLKKTIPNSKREWEIKKEQWRGSGMSKIIWLRMKSPWEKPPFYIFNPPEESGDIKGD